MTGWAGFWIMLAIIEIAETWKWIRRRELQCKYPKLRFKWYE